MTTTDQREQSVASALKEISHIATLPEVTLKIIELVEDPTSTAQDLHEVINNDPALCSRILKVVNSSFYGLPGQIGSINRAIVMLGLNAVKNIAIAASLTKLFRGGELTPAFSARDLWEHSVQTAATTKLISDSLKMGLGDEAFLAGLVHNIGTMVEMQFDRNKLIEVLRQVAPDTSGIPQQDMLTVEEQVFGANHQHFGSGLCEKWKFPSNFTAVTGFHHRPLDLDRERRTLTCMVYVADRLVGQMEGAYRLDLMSLDIDPAVLSELNMGSEKLAALRDQLPEHLNPVADILG